LLSNRQGPNTPQQQGPVCWYVVTNPERCYCWHPQELDEQLIEEVLGHLRTATDTASGWAKSWHHWGLFNLALLGHHAANREPAKAQQHVAPAVVGFFRSVALGQMEGKGLVWVHGYIRVFKAVAPAVVGLFRGAPWRSVR
jgi:FAT domain